MPVLNHLRKPTKTERRIASTSYEALLNALKGLDLEAPEIEIQQTNESIQVPRYALELLVQILEETSKGRIVTVASRSTEMTTQAAAEFLGCSRPHLVKMLEEGAIPFTKIGKHRRVRLEDLMDYKEAKKEEQRSLLIEIIKSDEESGLYDS